ncbi:MAG: hypothetical protein ACW98D_05835 [Promethearchaeota archaeon]|jgi:hypothetical protein
MGDDFDFNRFGFSKADLLKYMRLMLERAQLKVLITVPNITDLRDLEVYNVRANVNRRICGLVDKENDDHLEILEELRVFANVRNYKGEDRYVFLRDGEELLFAALGVNKDITLSFHTNDVAHIKLFNGLAMEAWLKSREI